MSMILPAALFALTSAEIQADDREPIRAHLERVERQLRARDDGALPPPLRAARHTNLDRLRDYRIRGEFPVNPYLPGWVPYFIDRDGRECAVGALIVESGRSDLAERIASTDNNAYLADLHDTELDDWIAESGLTHEECALIQPSYNWDATPPDAPTTNEAGPEASVDTAIEAPAEAPAEAASRDTSEAPPGDLQSRSSGCAIPGEAGVPGPAVGLVLLALALARRRG